MAFLRNNVLEIKAILTKKGRELLSRGQFNVTQFALSDDEIDYSLWNPNNPQGSEYYGELIESMNVLEPIPDERLQLRNKLVTLPRNTTKMPVITIGIPGNTIELTPGGTMTITPQTLNIANGNIIYGYTAIVDNGDIVEIMIAPDGQIATNINASTITTQYVPGTATSVAIIGKKFIIKGINPYTDRNLQTKLTIIGNETGGYNEYTIIVKKRTENVL